MKRFYISCIFLCMAFNAQAGDDVHTFESPMGLELLHSTLGDVASRFGAAKRFQEPESHHEFGLCYTVKDSTAVVIFGSGLEFGGPEYALLTFRVLDKNDQKLPCFPSAITASNLRLGNVSLGISKSQFIAAVGEPVTEFDKNGIQHFFEWQRHPTITELEQFDDEYLEKHGEPVLDVLVAVWARFDNGVLVEFGSSKIETY